MQSMSHLKEHLYFRLFAVQLAYKGARGVESNAHFISMISRLHKTEFAISSFLYLKSVCFTADGASCPVAVSKHFFIHHQSEVYITAGLFRSPIHFPF